MAIVVIARLKPSQIIVASKVLAPQLVKMLPSKVVILSASLI